MSKKQSVRVQLYPEVVKKLTDIAYGLGYIYGRKGNLSILLTKIAEGKLQLDVDDSNIKQDIYTDNLSLNLIGLEVAIFCDLNGSIACIAQKIADAGGNIYDIKTGEGNPKILITLEMPEDSDLNELIAKLKEIKIKDVLKFKQLKPKLKELLRVLEPEKGKAYEILEQDKTYQLTDDRLDNLLSKFSEFKFLKNIVLSIGLRVHVRNTKGTLAKFTEKIAEKGVAILAINQIFSNIDKQNIADLSLGFYPLLEGDETLNKMKIKKINNFINNLKSIDGIEDLYQINITQLK